MAVWAYSVEKEIPWRNITERFSNVYHFSEGVLDLARHEAILDELVAAEKSVFANIVNFKAGAVWGPITGVAADSLVRLRKDYSGTGEILSAWPIHREASVVVAQPLPRGGAPFFRKRFLRKFLHVGALASGDSSLAIGTSAIPQAERDRFVTFMNRVDTITVLGASYRLCAPNGDTRTGPPYVLPYPHIRQFRR